MLKSPTGNTDVREVNTGTCPRCRARLERVATPGGARERCPACRGQALTAAVLGKGTTPGVVRSLLAAASRAARGDNDGSDALSADRAGAPCPWCAHTMSAVNTVVDDRLDVEVDVCDVCQLLWFDAGEYERLPKQSGGAGATPRIDEIHCGHCGAPARPDLDSYCRYCHQPMAPARTPGVAPSSVVPYEPDPEERPAATDWVSGLFRLLG